MTPGRRFTAIDVASVVMAVSMFYLGTVHNGLILNTVVCGVICLVPPVLRYSGVAELPTPIAVMVLVAPWLHGFGLALGLYISHPDYDSITHSVSSMVITVLVFYALTAFQHYGSGNVNFAGRGLALMTGLISISFGVYWEVIEYLSDVFTTSVTQYSPFDTLSDLVCDSIGASIGSAWAGFYMRNRSAAEVMDSFHFGDAIMDLVKRG